MPIRRLVIFLVGCLLLSTCTTDSPTEPGTNPNPSEPPSFPVSYTTDDARAVSTRISAIAGGSLAATDANGAEFRLIVPPGALDSSTTITITPLSCLTIGGPGATRCSDTDTSGGRCCLTGAVFAPAGLVLAEPAVLEISYSGPFPFETSGSLIYFDASDSTFMPCSTQVDAGGGLLRGTVRHFSGYGAAAPDSVQLMALYEYWRATTTGEIGHAPGFNNAVRGLLDVASANWQLDMFGEAQPICSGLNELIEQTVIGLLNSHGLALNAIAQQSMGQADVADLIAFHMLLEEIKTRLTGNLQWACIQNQAAAISAIDPIVRKFAEQGHALCEQDNCDGRNDLQWAFDIWIQGYFKDNAYGSTIRNRLEDCCSELDVAISVSPSVLKRAGIREDDIAGTYATVTVTVTGQSGQPREGVFVAVKWSKNISTLCSGTTNASGVFTGYFSAHLPTTAYTCQAELVYDVWAEASWVGGTFTSLETPVVFQNAMVSASFSYTYEFYLDGPGYPASTSCMVAGTMESPAGFGCSGNCGDGLTRSYSHVRGPTTLTLIDNARIDACLGSASFASQQILVGEETYLTVLYINGVSISNPCIGFENAVLEICDPIYGCRIDTVDIPASTTHAAGIWYPGVCDGIFMQPDGAGGYQTFLWTHVDDFRTATWSIDASAGYGFK